MPACHRSRKAFEEWARTTTANSPVLEIASNCVLSNPRGRNLYCRTCGQKFEWLAFHRACHKQSSVHREKNELRESSRAER